MTSLLFLTFDVLIYSAVGLTKTIYQVGKYAIYGTQKREIQQYLTTEDLQEIKTELKSLNSILKKNKKNV